MKSLKTIVSTVLLSAALISGVSVSTITFAYSPAVEKKLEKIDKDIEKQNEKISKQQQKRSSRNSSSSSTSGSTSSSSKKISKIREKIADLEEDAADIRKKEDAKIAKVVKAMDGRKKQSNNKIQSLNKSKATKLEAAKKKYENDVKARKETDPNYKAPPFKFNSDSIDKQIAIEKQKLLELNEDIAKARGTYKPRSSKKNK